MQLQNKILSATKASKNQFEHKKLFIQKKEFTTISTSEILTITV